MKRLIVLLIVAAAVAGGWFVGSRFYALYDLREAARSGDVARLEGRVDFPAFRDSLKAEVGGAIERERMGSSDLGTRLAKAGAGLAIDGLVTPEAVATLVRSGQAAGVTVARREDATEPVEWHIEGDGLHAFRLVTSDSDGALIFRRDGLGWKLAGIDLDGI
ncbi:DUF2939 domain-containing protein [Croceicoccus naphthovorans]|uniref:Uncharacterized protein n=1 Tax=Croceicoccus naphthovorans TaxID=1348774 RepID=A0A0G3XKY4_9SPHN|nr:DUF2939 domain-containing protein [Croceicoccus naphthovorans]AKM11261.1 hypothetical protein AB433_16800 [Croceicoccus naphthovorans]MBB3989831.1 hypothetical protein [Croceicoccus naphthovorans]